MKYVYIIDKHGKPLMPTTRFGHIRKLMKSGKAVPISNNPFTIRLKYDTTSYTQDLWEGIDTGRQNIGDAVSDKDGKNVYLADVCTNNKSIKSNMRKRCIIARFVATNFS